MKPRLFFGLVLLATLAVLPLGGATAQDPVPGSTIVVALSEEPDTLYVYGTSQLAARHVDALSKFLMRPHYSDEASRLSIPERLDHARQRLDAARKPGYAQSLVGTLGRQPRFTPEP